jgi:methylglutaconyl-CoA hydratase
MPESEPVVYSIEEGVARIRLDRPDKRNALSLELLRALSAAVDRAASEPDLRVVLLEGADPCFCAGLDLKAALEEPDVIRSMLLAFARTTTSIRRLDAPTIAKVQGAAIGGGCGLMVVCDFAVTHPEAKLGYPEVDFGISPAVVAPWLVRKIGPGAARAMLLAGGTMNGREGFDAGLATSLVEQNALEDTVEDLIGRLLKSGRQATIATKRCLNELDGANVEEEVLRGVELSAKIMGGEDAQDRLKRRFSQ